MSTALPKPQRRRRAAACASRRQRGYSLLEVIVAFALLALALTLLLGTMSGATRQVRWAAGSGRAALHAQSLLDAVGVAEPLHVGQTNGELEEGRYRWELEVRRWQDPTQPPGGQQDAANAQLFELHLTMHWGQDRGRERLELRTLRLALPEVNP